MKKKLSTYLSLLVMISSFITTPLTVLAETTSTTADSTQQTQADSTKSEESITKETEVSNASQVESPVKETTETMTSDSSTLERTQTDQKQASETTQSTDQQTRAPSRVKRAAQNNVITSFTITDKNGNPLDHAVGQWENFRINGAFALPNGQISEGDTTTITLPSELKFGNTTAFELKDAAGNVVANATISPDTKQVVLTYTNYAETHSDVKGSFFFYAGVDTTVVKEKGKIQSTIDVEGNTFPIEVDFDGIEESSQPLTKAGWFKSGSDKELQYYLALNRSKKSYPNAVLTDNLKSSAVTYTPGSFKIYKGQWQRNATGTDWELANRVDVTANYPVNISEDNRSFSINFGNIGEEDQFALYYNAELSYTPVDGENIVNTAVLTSNDEFIYDGTANTNYQKGGGEAEGYNFTINIHKENEDKQALAGAEFEIIRDTTGQVVGTITADGNGDGAVGQLLKDTYTIKETKAPDGYELSNEEIKISPDDFGTDKAVLKTVVNKKKEEPKIDISGTKTWNDANNQDGKRPDKITVNLLADGEQVATKEVTEADGWNYEFKDLPKFKDGNEIVYTVTENQVADYNTEVKGFDLTNSYTPGKTSVSVTKKWEDANNQDGKRPNSIQVQLLADGKKQGDVVELNAANNWTTTWNDLAQKANGKDIVYTIEEVKVPGYTTTVDDTDKGNILLTNTYTPETTEVKGTKTWNDANNQDGKRPDKITVNLLADGEQVATKEVTEADGWNYEFKDLPKFKDGKEIVYTVTENTVKDYTTMIKGYNITNTYNPGKISGTVTKRWEDTNNQDGLRPNSIKIQLYANGKKQGQPVELTEKGHWTYSWKELDATDKNGKGIQYSIKEVDVVNGYTATITGENIGNLLITNTHTPTTPNKPKTPTKPETPSTPGKHLPKTGEVNVIWWTVVGTLLISSVGGYLYFRKKVER